MYERNLIEYLPEFLREVKENHAILNLAEQPEMVLSWDAVDDAMKDQFIREATNNGLSRLEKIMKIVPPIDATLDERRFAILTRMNEELPFTYKALKKKLTSLCGEDGFEVDRDIDKKILYVKVSVTQKHNFDKVAEMLERIVPAHMIIDLSLSYTQHGQINSKPYRHIDLQPYTHRGIRNKELV